MKMTTTALKKLIYAIVARFIVGILSRMYRIDNPKGDTDEAKIRSMITIMELRFWQQVDSKVMFEIETRSNEYTDMLKEAICEGMNIECSASASIADLFKCIDTSVTDRISRALHLRNVASRHPMNDIRKEDTEYVDRQYFDQDQISRAFKRHRDWRFDCYELESMIDLFCRTEIYNGQDTVEEVWKRLDDARNRLFESFIIYKKARKEDV